MPIQDNFWDCGIFLLHFVERFLSNPEELIAYVVCYNIFLLSHAHWTFTQTTQSAKSKDLKGKAKKENPTGPASWSKEVLKNRRREMRADILALSEEWAVIKAQRDIEEREAKAKRRAEKEAKAKGEASLEDEIVAFTMKESKLNAEANAEPVSVSNSKVRLRSDSLVLRWLTLRCQTACSSRQWIKQETKDESGN